MLEELGTYEAEIIFTTAYNNFAIDAMRISAFDYLVKPVSIEELENAVKRLVQKKTMQTRDRLTVLKQSINENKSQENKIAVPLNDGLEFIVIKNIQGLNPVQVTPGFSFTGGQTILVTKLLKDFEELLIPYRIFSGS